jgi:hypothetical protein
VNAVGNINNVPISAAYLVTPSAQIINSPLWNYSGTPGFIVTGTTISYYNSFFPPASEQPLVRWSYMVFLLLN